MVFEHDYKNYPELTNRQIEEFGFSSPHVQFTEDFDAVVIRVIDGDTVMLSSAQRGFFFPLRLLNVDALEIREGGQSARDWLKNRVEGEGVRVLINKSQRVGKYGRLLGRIIHLGLDVSEEMLHLGLVKPFDRKDEGKIPPLSKFMSQGGFI